MADTKISELGVITQGDIASGDWVAVVDSSENATKKFDFSVVIAATNSFDDVTAFFANTDTYAADTIVRTRAEGFAYRAVDTATASTVANAGGQAFEEVGSPSLATCVSYGFVQVVGSRKQSRTFFPSQYATHRECLQAANDYGAKNCDGYDIHIPATPEGADFWSISGTVFFGSLDTSKPNDAEFASLFALPAGFVTDQRTLESQRRVIGHGFKMRRFRSAEADLGREMADSITSPDDDDSDCFVFFGVGELRDISFDFDDRKKNGVRAFKATPFYSNAAYLDGNGVAFVLDSLCYGFQINTYSTPGPRGVIVQARNSAVAAGTTPPGNGVIHIVSDGEFARAFDDTVGGCPLTRIGGHIEGLGGADSAGEIAGRTDDGYRCGVKIDNQSVIHIMDGTLLSRGGSSNNNIWAAVSVGQNASVHFGSCQLFSVNGLDVVGGTALARDLYIASGSKMIPNDNDTGNTYLFRLADKRMNESQTLVAIVPDPVEITSLGSVTKKVMAKYPSPGNWRTGSLNDSNTPRLTTHSGWSLVAEGTATVSASGYKRVFGFHPSSDHPYLEWGFTAEPTSVVPVTIEYGFDGASVTPRWEVDINNGSGTDAIDVWYRLWGRIRNEALVEFG